ncbi:hypothetical protein [Polaromonas sp. JS666]|uniref:hypothetical protein n=1 Tax=Polaromonas sp. (strain JS666 / ATCC BAA-500) TaxID=296591 RepID=UPI0000538066|nr:hypothetical protein [Polaromonas sp. JS666]ABE46868.1 hypothetical protein Bpro_4996 [Polaromonas sp. JS666]
MTIDELSKVAGVLGFFMSLATFALTRWERRILVDFGLDAGTSADFRDESDQPMSIVNLTISNLGARSVLLDMRSLEVISSGNVLDAWRQDFWGPEVREVLLKPNDSHTIGIPLTTFMKELHIETPPKYDDRSFSLMHPVRICVKGANGKAYSSKQLRFWEATGEFHRAV